MLNGVYLFMALINNLAGSFCLKLTKCSFTCLTHHYVAAKHWARPCKTMLGKQVGQKTCFQLGCRFTANLFNQWILTIRGKDQSSTSLNGWISSTATLKFPTPDSTKIQCAPSQTNCTLGERKETCRNKPGGHSVCACFATFPSLITHFYSQISTNKYYTGTILWLLLSSLNVKDAKRKVSTTLVKVQVFSKICCFTSPQGY